MSLEEPRLNAFLFLVSYLILMIWFGVNIHACGSGIIFKRHWPLHVFFF